MDERNSVVWTAYSPSERLSTIGSLVMAAAGEDDGDLYSVLKSSIATLQELSYSISQTLVEMDIEVSKPRSNPGVNS